MWYIKDLFDWDTLWWGRQKFWLFPIPAGVFAWIMFFIGISLIPQDSLENYRNLNAIEINIKKLENIKQEDIDNIKKLQEYWIDLGAQMEDTIEETKQVLETRKEEILKLKESEDPSSKIVPILLMVLSFILVVYVNILNYVNRLRDKWRSGWMVLLLLVPIANLWLLIYCGFIR